MVPLTTRTTMTAMLVLFRLEMFASAELPSAGRGSITSKSSDAMLQNHLRQGGAMASPESMLRLSVNRFEGTLPEGVALWSSFSQLILVFLPGLSGTLPDAVASWSLMSMFQLGNILELKGALPDAVGSWTSARELDVSPHGFSASIPTAVASWRHMKIMYLSYGHFSGAFPDSVGSWISAESFSIDDNKMAGALPGA